MEKIFLTGQVAKKAGVNVETLRFYERKGLVPKPMRTDSGYRQYPGETIHRIHFIKHAQDLGFTLKEIKELLEISLATQAQCQRVRGELEHKLKEVNRKIEKLQEIRHALQSLRKKCEQGGVSGKCPILKCLYGGESHDKD